MTLGDDSTLCELGLHSFALISFPFPPIVFPFLFFCFFLALHCCVCVYPGSFVELLSILESACIICLNSIGSCTFHSNQR